MSKRNKLESKSERRANRKDAARFDDITQRIPVSTVPPPALLNILTDRRSKLSGRNRRRLMASRDVVLDAIRATPKGATKYFARKCGETTWERLNRKQRRVLRREEKIVSLLQSMAPGSKFRAPLEAELSILNLTYKAITNEIKLRTAIPADSL